MQTEIRNVFMVVPRNDNAIEAIFKEQNIQRSGVTDSKSIKAVGAATNADYVLAGNVMKLGASLNLFVVKILSVESGTLFEGSDAEYETMADSLKLMPELSQKLTGVKTLSRFYMAQYETTQKQWKEVMGSNPSYFTGDNLPVESVSWNEVIEYCNKLSEKEGLIAVYSDGYKSKRLPLTDGSRVGVCGRRRQENDAKKLRIAAVAI